ncbi:hypothetical protein Tco_0087638 [Tanacetum coccineum]
MTTKAQQIALDNALVAPENRCVIDKCKMRINPGMKPKEPTYQVATVNKHNASYRFKIDKKRFSVNVEVFKEILNICLRILGQEFDEPPSEEEALSFIRELSHSGEIKYITDVIVDHLHQPWRTFASIINKYLCGKVSGLDKIRLSRVQILWGMYYKKNLDFVALIWEDLAYQIDNKDSKKQDKILIMLLLQELNPQSQKKSDSTISSEKSPSKKKPASKPKLTKKKAQVKADKGKGLNVLSEAQIKEATKRSKKDFHISQASSSGNGTDFQSGVPNEQQRKISGTDEGTGAKPRVPDVPKYDYESDKESWGDSGEEDDDQDDTEDDEGNDDGDVSDGNDNDNDGNDDDDSQFNEEHEEDEEEKVNESTDKEDDEEELDDGDELYKDVNVNLRKEDVEMTNADQSGADQHNIS